MRSIAREAAEATPGRANIPTARGGRRGSAPRGLDAKREKKREHAVGARSARFGGRSGCAAIGRCVYWLDPLAGVPMSHETNVPAEEAQARPHARLPCADAHPRRPPDAEAPARQGPQAPDGVMVGRAWPASAAGAAGLSRSADFDRVFRQRPLARAGASWCSTCSRAASRRAAAARAVRVAEGRRRGRAQQGQAAAARGVRARRRGGCRPAPTPWWSRATRRARSLSVRAWTGSARAAAAADRVAAREPLLPCRSAADASERERRERRAIAGGAADPCSTSGCCRRSLGQRCKYYPSCSEYAAQAIMRFGILRGLVLAGWRLLRCNPWSHGGFDPVEDQRLFKPRRPPARAPDHAALREHLPAADRRLRVGPQVLPQLVGHPVGLVDRAADDR